jgi:predicted RNase H-like nuclease (RuvC/YqgF family)
MTTLDKIEEDVQNERIQQLEEIVLSLQAETQNLTAVLRDAQRIIVKLATSQQQLIERVSHWPYIKVDRDE